MASERPAQAVAALMLAAGYSRRFGADKRRLVLGDGRSLLAASLALPCSMLEEVWLVLRPDESITELGLPASIKLVQHPLTAQGMGHSLAAGAERLLVESDADSVAIFLADMPSIHRHSLEALMACAASNRIVLPSHQDKRGHPVVFGRDFWPQLATLGGDAGAKAVLQHNAEALHIVELDDPGVLQDIDTPADLIQL
ncbi:nucleotidyltransferase family protein [Ectopseudomonas toyotomiensis]|uniref:Molybdenum cofactor cytidylyltransferase n=1 Tax=Ectopseudomonas toyotomiensis TaxID=554344 RepID=A0A1I5N0F0_9GAMM|nr:MULTISPECIES: nucleotidyltransferase family protein [Pseudomonas]PIA74980.1 nucleotidyltransferase family protein [Pseudomonas toyotomiensis]SDA53877.1 molybdenum cofactor cytidylyltransferase [Pseudomonas sp. NFPP33]SFP15180.1 molybdenum cofactor cytidylyltransferase [Pseudomonas toyotomiensis]